MSRRPLDANPVRRAGDVDRRMWSESDIPRVATRRVRMVGMTCSDTAWLAPTSVAMPYLTFYDPAPEFGLADMLTGSAGQDTLGDNSDSTYYTGWNGGLTPYSSLDGWGPLSGLVEAGGFPAQPQIAACPLGWLDVSIRYRNPSAELGGSPFNSNLNLEMHDDTGAIDSMLFDQTFDLTTGDASGWLDHTWTFQVDTAWIGSTAHDRLRSALVDGTVAAWLYIDFTQADPAAWDLSEVRVRARVG